MPLEQRRILAKKTAEHIGEKVCLRGWINARRDHGKIIFIDIRDRSGLAQVVFSPTASEKVYKNAGKLRPEWVIEVIGHVKERPKGMQNVKIESGSVEIEAEELKVFSKAKTPPFSIEGEGYEINEEKRMKYRYLDLRRERLRRNLTKRHQVIQFIRQFLSKEDFIEVETPLLTKSTPEGARDFLVPSRLQPGKFYALPQSPQQFKQMLMVAGIERYFQIARCLRDEDPRGDRQAEHTQLDIEISFVEQEDILNLIERLYIELVKNIFPEKEIEKIPFPRLTYKEALEKYQTDKPDLRRKKNNSNKLSFCFITDFPMFEWHEKDKRWGAMHHPFTMPNFEGLTIEEGIKKMKKAPGEIKSFQYDLALNGYEIGGGSIRTTDLNLLTAVFEVLGHKAEEIKEKFKNYFEAFNYGVPPHGGIASGLDRFLSIALNEPNIREVIAFPKTGDNRDLMMGAPAEVDKEQLKELHLKLCDIQPHTTTGKKAVKKTSS